jgi:1-acyl-sn-glycerol-3-phosphate acyltransferase
MLRRPEVSLENYPTVYDYYENHNQSMPFARFAHVAIAQDFRPDITCDDGVEEAIHDELSNGSRLVVSPNHITDIDQYTIVSLVEKLKVLRPLRGRTFIPSKPVLFTHKGIRGKLLRRAIDGLGAIPAIRTEDLKRQGIEITEDVEQQYKEATIRASKTHVSKLLGGEHMAGFWEGTRNRKDYRTVQPLKKGIGYTAIEASNDVSIVLLPVGIYYGGEPDDYLKRKPKVPKVHHPHVHVGMPIPVETRDVDQLINMLHPAIQGCVDEVVPRAA